MTTTSSLETHEIKREGILTSFNPLKNCGTISSRTGMKVESFFFHSARVTYSEVELNQIGIGLWTRFRVSAVKPRPGDYRHAIDIELFAENPSLNGAMDALSGKTSSTEAGQ